MLFLGLVVIGFIALVVLVNEEDSDTKLERLLEELESNRSKKRRRQ